MVQSRGPDARGPEAVFSGPTVGSNTMQNVKVALPIVAVRIKVSGCNDRVDTYALLDSGSVHSFCTKELLDALKIEGRRESVVVSTLEGYSYEHAARTADLQVSGMYRQESLLLRNVHAKDSLPGLMGHVGTAADTLRWPHLSGLSLPTARAVQVALVIGQDNACGISSSLHSGWPVVEVSRTQLERVWVGHSTACSVKHKVVRHPTRVSLLQTVAAVS